MDAERASENTILYILLVTSLILVMIDTFEFIQIIKNWGNLNSMPYNVFETCFKWEFYAKTIFCIYSLMGALSAFILIKFLIFNANYFIEKFLPTYRVFNYIIFGPYLLGFSLLGLYNWNDVVFVCDKQNLKIKILSHSNLFSLIACFLLSLLITGLIMIVRAINIYFNSILNRPGGSPLIKKAFWKIIFRNREPVQFVRQAQRDHEERKENI